MDKHIIIKELKHLIRSGTDTEPQRGVNCLEPEVLAAFLDGSSSGKAQSAHEAHLADCAFCLHQLAQISRSLEDDGVTNIHPELLQQAEALGIREAGEQQPGFQRARRFLLTNRFPAVAAIAATVVLATSIVLINLGLELLSVLTQRISRPHAMPKPTPSIHACWRPPPAA